MNVPLRSALFALLLPSSGIALAQIAPPAASVTPMTSAATVPPGGGHMGSMTLAQFQARNAERMMAADTDGDGRISQAEYTAAMSARRGGGGGGGNDPSRTFARMDTDHDGYIDKAEIDAASAQRFRRMDTNGDGVVTPDERMAGRGRMGRRGDGGAPANGQMPAAMPQPQPQP